MPSRPPRICSCGKTVAAGVMCQCQRARNAERKAAHDAKRPSASARGYGTKWREARAAFLALNPTCARCGGPATIVDHVIPHRGDLKLFWRRSNWQPLCAPCHNGAKQSAERRVPGKRPSETSNSIPNSALIHTENAEKETSIATFPKTHSIE